jgi:hypothetical protein
MGFLDAVGIVGGLASVAGLIAAFYLARRDRRVKLLTYGTTPPIALASAISPEGEEYDLSVVYKPKTGRQTKIKSVNVRFLRFANLGREPIRRADIAPTKPLSIEVAGVRTLEISITGVSRDVSNIELTNERYENDSARADVLFDFLDHNDGGVIKIITVGGSGMVRLFGEIIGMPDGVRRIDEIRSMGLLNKVGCVCAAACEVASVASVPFIFFRVSGSWQHVWLLALPFIALFLPAALIAIVASTLWPDEHPSFPRSLSVPDWARRLEFLRFQADDERDFPIVAVELPRRVRDSKSDEKT